MIRLVVGILLSALVGTAGAASPTSFGFRAFSSASQVRCTVFGQSLWLHTDSNSKEIQAFAPNTLKSRSYLLGTKGFANHSTLNQVAISFTCTVDGTPTAAPVKVFMNGIETYYLTTDKDTFVIGR